MRMKDYHKKEKDKKEMMEALTRERMADAFFNLLEERNEMALEFYVPSSISKCNTCRF